MSKKNKAKQNFTDLMEDVRRKLSNLSLKKKKKKKRQKEKKNILCIIC